MEQEYSQMQKRLEWLDDERRKDKNTITALEQRIAAIESGTTGINQEVKILSNDFIRMSTMLSRFEQIDNSMAQLKTEILRTIEGIEKTRTDANRAASKIRLTDVEKLNKGLDELSQAAAQMGEIKKNLQNRVDEEFRLGRLIEEAEKKISEINRNDEEYKRTLKILDDSRRQDNKRLTDMQGEVTAFRKRLEESRGKMDLAIESMRKYEARLNEFQAAETERRQSQSAFLEKQALQQVERDRTWKEWTARFEGIEKQGSSLEAQLQALDTTHRAIKRSQDGLDEVTIRFERRINELTEMQRLVEDRFRQEWLSFKAEDQKRWTNYTLAQEEQERDTTRQFEKADSRLISLEDGTQEMHDLLTQVNSETMRRLQTILEATHEWVETFERLTGRKQ